jgi:hypothetical protein
MFGPDEALGTVFTDGLLPSSPLKAHSGLEERNRLSTIHAILDDMPIPLHAITGCTN